MNKLSLKTVGRELNDGCVVSENFSVVRRHQKAACNALHLLSASRCYTQTTRGRRRNREERDVGLYIKRPRCETNGGSESEVTVSSKRHAQVERAKEEKRENAASMRGAGRDPGPEDGAEVRGRWRARPKARAADDLSAEGSGLRARQKGGA